MLRLQTQASQTSAKKTSGTLSYEDSYTDAVASKWESKGGYDAYEKAAKAWNQKKYGTTEPTAKAKKMTGGSKTELAKEHSRLKPVILIDIEFPLISLQNNIII